MIERGVQYRVGEYPPSFTLMRMGEADVWVHAERHPADAEYPHHMHITGKKKKQIVMPGEWMVTVLDTGETHILPDLLFRARKKETINVMECGH